MWIILYLLKKNLNRTLSEVLHLAGSLIQHFIEGSALKKGFNKLAQMRRFVLITVFMYQCLNGAIPSRKCNSIMLPAKGRIYLKKVNDWVHKK